MVADLQELAERYVDSRTGSGCPATERGRAKRANKIIKQGLDTYEVDGEAETFTWEPDGDKPSYEVAICGKHLLVTNTELEPNRVMDAYRELRDIE